MKICYTLKIFFSKHCECVLFVFVAVLVAVNYRDIFRWLSVEVGHNLWNMLTAIGTILAAAVAYYALKQAKQNADRTTFEHYFSQRLSNIREAVSDTRLSERTTFYRAKSVFFKERLRTVIHEVLSRNPPAPRHYTSDTYEISTFRAFVLGVNESISVSQGLTVRGLRQYWERYCCRLTYNAEFQLCFSVIYNAIEYVHHSNQTQEVKREYISILGRSLSLDVLFCYMISLFAYHNASPNEYGNILKFYGFFHRLFADRECKQIIRDALPHDMYALFNNE